MAATETAAAAVVAPAPAPLGPKPSAGPKTATAPQVPAQIVDPKSNTVYIKGGLLGTGGFAWVFEVRSAECPEPEAVKVVSKAALSKHKAREKLSTEIRIHRSLKHTNIVDFRHFFEDSLNVYIILELCESQTLAQLVKRRKRLSEPEVQYYMLQLLAAIRYMHTRNIIHRDLKLGNLFLNRDLEIKVGDFGLATVVNHEGERKRTLCGTPNYIAPEVLDDRSGHSYEVDIWSLGVIMYTMLVGRPPFETANLEQTYAKIRSNDYTFPAEVPLSTHARSLIRWLLQPRPTDRPSIDDIYASPFLSYTRPPTSLPATSRHSEPILLPSLGQALEPVASTRPVTKENVDPARKHVSSSLAPRRGLAELDANVADVGAQLARARIDGTDETDAKAALAAAPSRAPRAAHGDQENRAPVAPAAPLASRPSAGAPSTTTAPLAPRASAGAPTTAPLAARASAGSKTTTTTAGVTRPRARQPMRAVLSSIHEDEEEAATAVPSNPTVRRAEPAEPAPAVVPRRVPTPPEPEVPMRRSRTLVSTTPALTPIPELVSETLHANALFEPVPEPVVAKWGRSSTRTAPASAPAPAPAAAPAQALAEPAKPIVVETDIKPRPAAVASTTAPRAAAEPVTAAVVDSKARPAATTAPRAAAEPAPVAKPVVAIVAPAEPAIAARRTSPPPPPATTLVGPQAAPARALPLPSLAPAPVAARVQMPVPVPTPAAASLPAPVPAPSAAPAPSPVAAPAVAASGSLIVELHDRLQRVLQRMASVPTLATLGRPPVLGMPAPSPTTSVWVAKWVDYSTKYGLGYQLTGGNVGVLFNDKSSLAFLPGDQSVEYVESTKLAGKPEIMPVAVANKLHAKKMSLLLYFKSYIEDSLNKEGAKRPGAESATALGASKSADGGYPRVSRWFRTKHAILFRLSHGVLQFNFFDHSKLILEQASSVAVYMSPTRQQVTVDLDDLARRGQVADDELVKRLKYARDILAHLVASPSSASAAPSAAASAATADDGSASPQCA